MDASALAVQMYTIRDHIKTARDLEESLKKIRAIGYEAVQLSAVGAMEGDTPEVSAETARRMLDDNGLKCIATHRSWEALTSRTDAEIAFHRTLGCDFAAIGSLPAAYRSEGEAGYRRFVREAAPIIAALKAGGIAFGYHNHDFEFERVALETQPEFQTFVGDLEQQGWKYKKGRTPRTLFDILIDEGGPDLRLELDVYWVDHAGVNPVRILERSTGRVPVIHLKDKEVVPKDGPVMAAIGEGNLDWGDILPACQAAGVQWYAVEQDVCRRDPFDCLRSSFEFLTAFNPGM